MPTPSNVKVGDRIKLGKMVGETILPDTLGTVVSIRALADQEDIQMQWDNGSTLGLIYPLDDFEIVRTT